MSIYTAAYKQDTFAAVGKVIKQFDEQIVMSPDKSFLIFCQSLQGCQTAIDKMTRRADLHIIEGNDVLRKYLRGLAVVGHKPPAECDSMDSKYRDLYRNYNKYQESADPATYAHHATFSTKDALYAEILSIHTRWSMESFLPEVKSCTRKLGCHDPGFDGTHRHGSWSSARCL